MFLGFGLPTEEHPSTHQLHHAEAEKSDSKQPDKSVQADHFQNIQTNLGGSAPSIYVDGRWSRACFLRHFARLGITLEKIICCSELNYSDVFAHHTITHSETKARCVHTEGKPGSPQQSELLIVELNCSMMSASVLNCVPISLHTFTLRCDLLDVKCNQGKRYRTGFSREGGNSL